MNSTIASELVLVAKAIVGNGEWQEAYHIGMTGLDEAAALILKASDLLKQHGPGVKKALEQAKAEPQLIEIANVLFRSHSEVLALSKTIDSQRNALDFMVNGAVKKGKL